MEPGARLKNKDRGGFPKIGILPCLCVYLYFSYRIISFMDGIENLSCGYTIPGFYGFVVPGISSYTESSGRKPMARTTVYKKLIDQFNEFYGHIENAGDEYLLRGHKVTDFLAQGLKFIS